MASITTESGNRRMIQFVGKDGKRYSIRLGKCTKKRAEAIKLRVENLVSAQLSAVALDDDTTRWLMEIDDTLRDRLCRAGLVPKRDVMMLGAFLEAYLERHANIKPSTALVLGHTKRCLIQFFKADKMLRDITAGDADDWRVWLGTQNLSESTICRRCGIAKQFMRDAVKRRLVTVNVFAELKSANQVNDKRDYFITRDQAAKVLDACPDAQWRLLFALSRYGGLRCPSEHLALTWDDINWAEQRMTIHSPKTEHHPNGDKRVIPIFRELRPYLDDVYHQADPGRYVITKYRQANCNLRTQLERIIERAGLEAWPKLFHNLRAQQSNRTGDGVCAPYC